MQDTRISTGADKAGIASAILCMVHCLAVPLLFLVKLSFTHNSPGVTLPSWWEQMDYVFLAISFAAVYHAAGHARKQLIKRLLWAFWSVLAVAILFKSTLFWLTYIASFGLIGTHLLNIRSMRKG